MLLETVFLDERWIELQSGFLGGVLPSEKGNEGLALVALELNHLFAIVFDDVAVASCFGAESVICRRGDASRLRSRGLGCYQQAVLTKVLFDLLENLLAAELLGETCHGSDGLATISLCWLASCQHGCLLFGKGDKGAVQGQVARQLDVDMEMRLGRNVR